MCSAAACSWLSPVPTARTCAALPRASSARARVVGHGARFRRGSRLRAAAAAAATTSRTGTRDARRQPAAVFELGLRAEHLAGQRGQLDAHGAVRRGDLGERTRQHHALEHAPPQPERRRVAGRTRVRRRRRAPAARAPRSAAPGGPSSSGSAPTTRRPRPRRTARRRAARPAAGSCRRRSLPGAPPVATAGGVGAPSGSPATARSTLARSRELSVPAP